MFRWKTIVTFELRFTTLSLLVAERGLGFELLDSHCNLSGVAYRRVLSFKHHIELFVNQRCISQVEQRGLRLDYFPNCENAENELKYYEESNYPESGVFHWKQEVLVVNAKLHWKPEKQRESQKCY